MKKPTRSRKPKRNLFDRAHEKGAEFGRSFQMLIADAELYAVLVGFARGLVEADDELAAHAAAMDEGGAS